MACWNLFSLAVASGLSSLDCGSELGGSTSTGIAAMSIAQRWREQAVRGSGRRLLVLSKDHGRRHQ